MDECPDRKIVTTYNRTCVSDCPEYMEPYYGTPADHWQCVKTCPAVHVDRKCYTECPESSPYEDYNTRSCSEKCEYFRFNSIYCIDKCPYYMRLTVDKQDGLAPLCSRWCPPEQPYVWESKCLKECPPNTWSTIDVMTYDVTCVTTCPPHEIQPTSSNVTSCVTSCDVADMLVYRGRCVKKCPDGTNILTIKGLQSCVDQCPLSTYLLVEGHKDVMRTCVEECPQMNQIVYKGQCLSRCPYGDGFTYRETFNISDAEAYVMLCGRKKECEIYNFQRWTCFEPSECEAVRGNTYPLYDYNLKGTCISGTECRKPGRIIYAENKSCTGHCPPSTVQVNRKCTEIVDDNPFHRGTLEYLLYAIDHPRVEEAIDEVCYDNLIINCVEDWWETTSLWMLVISLTVCVIHLALLIWIVSAVRKQTVTNKTLNTADILEGWMQLSVANID